jgi:hypothetical protein
LTSRQSKSRSAYYFTHCGDALLVRTLFPLDNPVRYPAIFSLQMLCSGPCVLAKTTMQRRGASVHMLRHTMTPSFSTGVYCRNTAATRFGETRSLPALRRQTAQGETRYAGADPLTPFAAAMNRRLGLFRYEAAVTVTYIVRVCTTQYSCVVCLLSETCSQPLK